MNRIKDYSKLENQIVTWMKDYLKESGMKGWILGVSGGVDSAVVSTLAAKTGAPLTILEMPIKQESKQVSRAKEHILWLKENFNNIQSYEINLNSNFHEFGGTTIFNSFNLFLKQMNESLDITIKNEKTNLAEANSRSRLRMLMLYYAGTIFNSLVVGTGNKVEDFGVGFYTKYGDGGVDLSPIAALYKTEVRKLGKHMNIANSIVTAAPTDGLWDDGRTDEDQLGTTYENLEWAMEYVFNRQSGIFPSNENDWDIVLDFAGDEKTNAIMVLKERYKANLHKMKPIPICEISITNLKKIDL